MVIDLLLDIYLSLDSGKIGFSNTMMYRFIPLNLVKIFFISKYTNIKTLYRTTYPLKNIIEDVRAIFWPKCNRRRQSILNSKEVEM